MLKGFKFLTFDGSFSKWHHDSEGVKNSVHGAFILPSFADEVVDPESGHTVSTGHWQRCRVTLEVDEVAGRIWNLEGPTENERLGGGGGGRVD